MSGVRTLTITIATVPINNAVTGLPGCIVSTSRSNHRPEEWASGRRHAASCGWGL